MFVQIILVLCVLIVLIYTIVVPNPVKYMLLLSNEHPTVYTASNNARHFNIDDTIPLVLHDVPATDVKLYNATLYLGSESSAGSNLLVWFNGGGFLHTDRRSSFGVLNELSKSLKDFDLVTFEYPVRFRYTLSKSLDTVHRLLKTLRSYKPYPNLYAIGTSAGVLLSGAFQHNEIDDNAHEKIGIIRSGTPFRCIISLCGLLMPELEDYYLNAAFKFYILRGTHGSQYYTCLGLPKTPKFLISSTGDYLLRQTMRFLELEPQTMHIVFKNKQLRHSFALMPHFDETQKTIASVVRFLYDNAPHTHSQLNYDVSPDS